MNSMLEVTRNDSSGGFSLMFQVIVYWGRTEEKNKEQIFLVIVLSIQF